MVDAYEGLGYGGMSTSTRAFSRTSRLHWWQNYRNRALLISFLFVLPALINFAVFRYYPMIWATWISFWQYSLLGGFKQFVGLDNYFKALGDPSFFNSLRVTVYFTLLKVPIQIVLALALAVFANQPRRGMGVMRAFIFIPVVTS